LRFVYLPQGLTVVNSTWWSQCAVRFVRIAERTATYPLHVIDRVDFIIVMESVYRAVRTDCLVDVLGGCIWWMCLLNVFGVSTLWLYLVDVFGEYIWWLFGGCIPPTLKLAVHYLSIQFCMLQWTWFISQFENLLTSLKSLLGLICTHR
jgi:hypothetical protein